MLNRLKNKPIFKSLLSSFVTCSVLSKIIKYASSLVPGITKEFNDIDEAMRLGFNWAKGPFEMLEEIGVKNFFEKIDDFKGNDFLENLSKNKNEDFYGERQKYTNIETLVKPINEALNKSLIPSLFGEKAVGVMIFAPRPTIIV